MALQSPAAPQFVGTLQELSRIRHIENFLKVGIGLSSNCINMVEGVKFQG